jgi:hypothetical protein
MFLDQIQIKANVHITARERGKKVARLCRDGHNIWVNLGREYLAKVISPLAAFSGHVNNSITRYIGLGIGGDKQTVNIGVTYPTLQTHYPGQNTFNKDTLTTTTLERPIKVTGTAGVGASAGVWMNDVVAPPTFPSITEVEFQSLFSTSDMHLSGAYPAIPISEVGLMLNSQTASLLSNQVYDYTASPAYIQATRQTLIAYHPFAPLTKTNTVSLEIHWIIQF